MCFKILNSQPFPWVLQGNALLLPLAGKMKRIKAVHYSQHCVFKNLLDLASASLTFPYHHLFLCKWYFLSPYLIFCDILQVGEIVWWVLGHHDADRGGWVLYVVSERARSSNVLPETPWWEQRGWSDSPAMLLLENSWVKWGIAIYLLNHYYSHFKNSQFTSTGNEMMPGMLTRQNTLVFHISTRLCV